MTMHSCEDLEAWKLARELRKNISELTKTFPADEKFKLGDQIKRSSRSVTNNISEGFGRYHYQGRTSSSAGRQEARSTKRSIT